MMNVASVKKTLWLEEVLLVMWMCMLLTVLFVPDCAARGDTKSTSVPNNTLVSNRLAQAPRLPQCLAPTDGAATPCPKCKSSKKTLAQTTASTPIQTTPQEGTSRPGTSPSPSKTLRGDGGYCTNNCSCGCNEGRPCECHKLSSQALQGVQASPQQGYILQGYAPQQSYMQIPQAQQMLVPSVSAGVANCPT